MTTGLHQEFRIAQYQSLINGKTEIYNTEFGRVYVKDIPYPAMTAFWGKSLKPYSNYRYLSIDARDKAVKFFIDSLNISASYKKERKEKRQTARANFQNPFKIGDILHHSWGWEQTNCDFYQVITTTNKTVTLAPIGAKDMESSGYSSMATHYIAVKDQFIIKKCHALTKYGGEMSLDKPVTKTIGFSVNDDGSLSYFIPTPYGYCNLWDGKPEYCSWYA